MALAELVEAGLDYSLCRYGASRLAFRGPPKRLDGNYIVVLGGTAAFGRFVADPFPEVLQDALGTRTINLGQVNAGLDVYLEDEAVLDICAGARLSVIQVTGAQNVSNRFYRVHPRRNDRFVTVSDLMRRAFPDIDFTEFHFTRHMLGALAAESGQRFQLVRDELRKTWVTKMNRLTNRIGTRVVLLWIGDRTPDDAGAWIGDGEPLFVTRQMLSALRGRIVDIVEMPPLVAPGLEGKLLRPGEERAALGVPGPADHEEIAERLEKVIRERHLLR